MSAAPVCLYGTPIAEHELGPLFTCAACRDETARMREAFRLAVAAGTYDARGYTPAEERASRAARRARGIAW